MDDSTLACMVILGALGVVNFILTLVCFSRQTEQDIRIDNRREDILNLLRQISYQDERILKLEEFLDAWKRPRS